jgi:Icc-related predicted phosphoesterase
VKIVCISDTHSMGPQIRVPDGDVLVHAGDHTFHGTRSEVARAVDWLAAMPHPHKIIIAGNHDWAFEKDAAATEKFVADMGLTYLKDSGTRIDNLNFWGAPWQPWFHDWAFNVRRGELTPYWQKIPDTTNVLITHGPPFGIMDTARYGEHVGCSELGARIDSLPDLKLHVFGHIHEGYGRVKINDVLYVNASTCNSKYSPINAPIEVEL